MTDATTMPVPITLSREARAYIWAEAVRSGVQFEYGYRFAFDAERRMLVRPELIFRGSRDRCMLAIEQLDPGDVCLHTHPAGSTTEPSKADMDLAADHIRLGVAHGIALNDGSELRMLTEPETLRRRSFNAHAAADALYVGRRRFAVGTRYIEMVPKLRQITLVY